MKNKGYLVCGLLLIVNLLSCVNFKDNMRNSYMNIDEQRFCYQGRTQKLNDNTMALISTGSSVSFEFEGDYCEIYLEEENHKYNYVSLELDNKYLYRLKIEGGSLKTHKIAVPKTGNNHLLKVLKESEASNGPILFKGAKVKKLLPNKNSELELIEFIGNSITCGAAADSSVTPCDTGEYFDHQNVYYAYGPRVARKLNTDFILSSVSGIGIYRNWNDENIEEPTMIQVYENLDFSLNNKAKYNFSRKPNIVSICLGTNDLSNGDGIKPRLPFNKEKFTKNYISFVSKIFSHYPNTKIVLLTSPMVSVNDKDILLGCLKNVKNNFKDQNISIFELELMNPKGCSYHPSVEDHGKIEEQLTPYFLKLMNKKIN